MTANYQTNSNASVAYKVQSGKGTQASSTGGLLLPVTGGSGGSLSKAATESNQVRRDGMRIRGRHGSQKTAGAWTAEMSLGSHDKIAEAVMRDTWGADLTLTQTDFTSLYTTTSTIVNPGSAVDFRTLGIRVGDVIRCTGLADAGNNSKNIRVSGLTATTITTPDTLIANATPDTTCSILRPKKLIQYSAASLVKRYFTTDEYDADIDQSEVMTDFVWGSLKFSMSTDGILTADPGGIGTGQFDALATGSSPLLTSPTEFTGSPFAVVDATIRVGGVDMVSLSSMDLTLDIGVTAPSTFGSGAQKYSPDVFAGQMGIAFNFTALRSDLQFMQDYLAETPYSLHILAVENKSEPKDFFSIYVGNMTLGGVVKSALSKQGGARTVQVSVPQALIGKDTNGAGFDPTMIRFQSTAP